MGDLTFFRLLQDCLLEAVVYLLIYVALLKVIATNNFLFIE